jgi:pimeloyl-ACP methyl ester carboxylesterase
MARPLAQTDERCFAETGHCISGRIREFWEQNGGLRVFGLPITPQRAETLGDWTGQVQWFERNRLELHPQNPPPFDVLLGRLGVDALEAQGRNWHAFPDAAPQEGCRFFAETGQNICGAMLAAWQASGLELDGRVGTSEAESLALFGMPISPLQEEEINGQRYQVQWFERARLELHPQNPPSSRVLLGLLGRELQGEAVVAAPVRLSRFEAGPCPFGTGGMRVDCGTLIVPQNREQPDGMMIRLAVAVVRTGGANPAPDPVVYLSGGPGSPALSDAVAFAQGWSSFLGNRDFVVIDQRGTGFSRPFLGCPEVVEFYRGERADLIDRRERLRAEGLALLRCHDRLASEGVDMAQYHSAANAADLEDLRQALGYAQWNLFGISYGTRLALTAMRDYPAGIRSVILDSTYPLQAGLYSELPANIDRSFRTLFDHCAADPGCNSAYPDLENVFYALVDRLNAEPITVRGRRIDGAALTEVLFRSLYRTGEIPGLPAMIYAAHGGDYNELGRLAVARLGGGGGPAFSQGVYFAVQCAEEMPFAPLEEVQAAAAAYPRLEPFLLGMMEFSPEVYAVCEAYGSAPPSPAENEPVVSAIPALLLAGEYDPITPAHWAHQAAETLSTSYVYAFSRTGHAVIARGACPSSLVRAFLNNPAVPPDSSCVR